MPISQSKQIINAELEIKKKNPTYLNCKSFQMFLYISILHFNI